MPIIESVASAVLESVVGKAVDRLFEIVDISTSDAAAGSPTPNRVQIHPNLYLFAHQVREQLIHHLELNEKWSRTINFDHTDQPKRISQVYVELDAFVVPLVDNISSAESASPIRRREEPFRQVTSATEPLLDALVERPEHCVLLGQAGAGKTTSVQRIADDFFRSGKTLRNYSFPIILRLRDLPKTSGEFVLGPIYSQICSTLGIRIESGRLSQLDADQRDNTRRGLELSVSRFVDAFRCVILLDGFDEILKPNVRNAALAEIKTLFGSLASSKAILTSRTSDFGYTLPGSKRLELAPLTKDQVAIFARRWFQKKSDAEEFLAKLFETPFADTAARPLAIAHLCAIFEISGKIPDKPKSVYRRLVYLLLEDWDSQRDVKRSSRYSEFDTDRKIDFLAALSFFLTADHQATRFDSSLLKKVYLMICDEFDLPKREAAMVAKEIESHSGLLLETGNRIYEFSHKSLQEFFSADYIVRLAVPAEHRRRLIKLPNELAIAISLSSSPTRYFAEIALSVLEDDFAGNEFYPAFLARLRLEKVNLVFSDHAAIAACIVIDRAGDQSDFRLFDNVLRGKYPDALYSHYRKSELGTDYNSFFLQKESSQYRLPKTITIPRDIHRQLLNLPVRAPERPE